MEPVKNSRIISSEDIVNHFTGEGNNLSEVVLSKVIETQKRIINKNEGINLYRRLNADDEWVSGVRVLTLNSAKIRNILIGCTTVGAAVGGIFATIFNLGTYKGAALGGATGFSVGTGYCVKNDLFSLAWKDAKNVSLITNKKIRSFHVDCTVEQYSLFKKFIDNYIQFVDEECEDKFRDLYCSINQSLPDFPVFSPHDEKRRYVFDKSAIEAHLNNVDIKILRAKLNNASPEQIAELMTTYCPFRGPPFTKKELVTDIRYLHKVISLIRDSLKSVAEDATYTEYRDPIIQKGLKCLLDHYKGQYDECSKVIVDKLFDDCVKLGTPLSMSLEVCKAFEANFDEMKKV